MVLTVFARMDARQFSVMRVDKDWEQEELAVFAQLTVEAKLTVDDVVWPIVIGKVIERSKDMMPKELQRKLSPRREGDHLIKLELCAKSLTMTPYCMAISKLKKFQK